MSSDTTQTVSTTDETTEVAPEIPSLTAEQEINALRSVHEFLSSFDRVPGFLTNKWSQALDTVAVVANSLIAKAKANSTISDASAESASEENAQ